MKVGIASSAMLGAGGMATVYLAGDIKHHRKVAIKVLREDLSASVGASRFLREIEIAAQLQHPNVLPLLDSGEAGGLLYYVMPYVEGQSLRQRLARERELPIGESVRILIEIVDALAYAHAHGVVHRDVKPDNVMLSGRHALVADFGIARAVSGSASQGALTAMGVALGTPACMAPEQAVADPNVDHRADIYSVGIVAYEVLAGRPPFTGTPRQVLAAQVTEQPDPLSKYRPGVPRALEQIIMRCLEKHPADRWQNANDLLAALEPLARTSRGYETTTARATVSLGRSILPWATVAVSVVIATVAFIVLHGNRDLQWSPDGRWIAASSGNMQFAFGTSGLGNVRGSGITLLGTDGRRQVTLPLDSSAMEISPVWTPDSKHLLFVSSRDGGRDAYEAAIDDDGKEGKPVRLTTGLLAHSISLARDAHTLAYSSYTPAGNVWVVH